jgi:hypothetical protein
VKLGSDLESSIWLMAAKVYGTSLKEVVGHALTQYKRSPGHDDLTRLHASMAGIVGIDALTPFFPVAAPGGRRTDYVEIRHRLRWYIVRRLQQRLVREGHATEAMRDDLLAIDLGL